MNKALHDLLKQSRSWQFEWGKHDCCTLANEVCKTLVGKDLIGNLSYDSRLSAIRMLKKNKITVESVLDDNFERIEYSFTRVGDLVMIESPQGPALTIKVHGGVWAMSEQGAMLFRQFSVIKCWRLE